MLNPSIRSTDPPVVSDPIRETDDPAKIWDAVRKLESEPPLSECTRDSASAEREYCVMLGNSWYSLDSVRRILLADESQLAMLSDSQVPLTWLEYPFHRNYREDLPADQSQSDEHYESLCERAFTFAQTVVAVIRESRADWPEYDSKPGERLAEECLIALGRVSQLARSAMPRSLLRAGKAVLFVERQSDPVGRWYAAKQLEGNPSEPEGDPVYFRALLRDTVVLLEGFDDESADHFATVILDHLLDGEQTFPGFRVWNVDDQQIALLWEA